MSDSINSVDAEVHDERDGWKRSAPYKEGSMVTTRAQSKQQVLFVSVLTPFLTR